MLAKSQSLTKEETISDPQDVGGHTRRDLLGIEGLSGNEITNILDTSDAYYEELVSSGPLQSRDILHGRTVLNLFFENSTRTRVSFELAEQRLGAAFASFSAQSSSLNKGESLLDTVRVLEAMKVDAIVVRHKAAGVPAFIAEHLPAHVRVINAGDGAHEHPTQALLDAASLRESIGALKGKRVLIVGDIRHSRVARSNVWLLKKLGASVTLVGPETLMPRHAESVFGCEIRNDLNADLLRSADAIMTLRLQLERQTSGLLPSLAEFAERYGITGKRLLGSNAAILHPGPVNVGVEVDWDAAEGEHSLILKQVKRGVAVRMAVLDILFRPPTQADTHSN